MSDKKMISESEWKVLEVLWKSPGLLIGEIRDALSESGWSYSTIKTLVLRLSQKGAIRAEASPQGKMYYPEVDEDASRLRETKSFIDRIYNGSVHMMFSNLVKDSALSADEAEELLGLIDKMEE